LKNPIVFKGTTKNPVTSFPITGKNIKKPCPITVASPNTSNLGT